MTPAEEEAARTRKRGGTGCVVGFCLVLLSVVPMLLGNERSTSELMPFGVALLPVALLTGVFGGVACIIVFFLANPVIRGILDVIELLFDVRPV